MTATPRPRGGAPAQTPRFYSPDFRRRLRDAGAFRDLSPSEHVVLAALCDRANASGTAWPAVETIADQYGLGESTVREAIKRLTRRGLLMVVRQAGRTNTYRLLEPGQGDAPAGDTPAKPRTLPRQKADPTLQELAPIMTSDHLSDHDHEQQQVPEYEGVDVVVSATPSEREAPPPSAPDASEKAGGDDETIQLLAEDLRERLRALGLAPAKVNRYGSDRVRWVLEALEAERARKVIGNPAGWMMQALKDNWDLPPAIIQHALPFAAAAVEISKPPEGTRWARCRKTRHVFEVADIDDIRVQFTGGFNAPAIPAHRWGDWEWSAEHPGDRTEAAGELAEDGLLNDEDLDPAKRADLARVDAWAALKKPTPGQLADKLQASGLTMDEWEAFQAVQAIAGQLGDQRDS